MPKTLLAEIAFRAVGTSVTNFPAFEMTVEIETSVYSAVFWRHLLLNCIPTNYESFLQKYRFFCAQFLQSESFFLCKNCDCD